jgi:predicted lipoprotein
VNKYIKYSLLLVVFALLAYKSVYFKKLSAVKKITNEKFDAVAFAKKLWDEKLPAKIENAIELTILIKAIAADPNIAFEKYSNAMAVGNYRYAMVKADAKVVQVNEDDLWLQLPFADSLLNVKVATEFVYGNAIRDASNLLQVKDFPNTADLSSISEELNRTVRTEVLAPFKKIVKKGDTIIVTGAIEINKAHINWSEPEIIPVRLQIKN